MRLVALGHTNKEIATMLDISKRTVDMHRAHAKRAIGARNLPEIVRWARDNGLFAPLDGIEPRNPQTGANPEDALRD